MSSISTSSCPVCDRPVEAGMDACPSCGTPLLQERDKTRMRIDALIGAPVGDYRVEARLGMGGMGIVYEGVHPTIGKRVAIKVLRPDAAHGPEQVQQLID